MKAMSTSFMSGLLVLLTGCVSLNSVSQTQIPEDRSNQITAESSRLIILGLNFDNDYVDLVSRRLRSQCKGGKVRGILTKDEVITYFLFVDRRRVSATGYCVHETEEGV
jgi:hypothetical protein